MSTPHVWPGAARAAWRARWQALAPRERRAVVAAAAVLAAYALWAFAVQPAWRTVRTSPAQLAALEAEWQAMQRLATEARSLRALPPPAPAQAAAALQASTARLGSAGRLAVQGERAVLTLSDCPPQALVAWLAEARSGARASPVEARLTRSERGLSGTVVVTLWATP